MPLLLTIGDVAAALRWSRSKTYRLVARGDIRSVRVDGSRRIKVRDLEEYVAALPTRTAVGDQAQGSPLRDRRGRRGSPTPPPSRPDLPSARDRAFMR